MNEFFTFTSFTESFSDHRHYGWAWPVPSFPRWQKRRPTAGEPHHFPGHGSPGSGTGAQGAIRKTPGVSEALIERHQGAAMLALLFMEITGALALVGLWKSHGSSRPARWNWSLSAILIFSIVTVGLMSRVWTTGGDIRHPEIGFGQEAVAEGLMMSKWIHEMEPSPARVADLMTANKWWWAFMMDLHFVGLVLLIGTVGILYLRMLGFAKQIPIDPLQRLVLLDRRIRLCGGARTW